MPQEFGPNCGTISARVVNLKETCQHLYTSFCCSNELLECKCMYIGAFMGVGNFPMSMRKDGRDKGVVGVVEPGPSWFKNTGVMEGNVKSREPGGTVNPDSVQKRWR